MTPNHIELKYETPSFQTLSQALLRNTSGATSKCPQDEECGDDTECITEVDLPV